jgi:hypothetical protein
MNDWQTWAAPAVVIATLAILVWRNLRPAKEAGCDKDCGCEKSSE